MSKICYIDTETTGLDPEKNGIIQISGMIEIDTKIVGDPFDFKIMPYSGDEIEDRALATSYTKREHLHEPEYQNPALIKHVFLNILGKHVAKFDKTDKFTFIGYNARFDMDFLREWFLKAGDSYFGSWFWFPPIDIMGLAAQKLMAERHTMANFKQGTVAAKLGIDVDESRLHDSLYDIEIARKIYYLCK